MVLLVNIVCALIFCEIFRLSKGEAEKESKNGMCSKRVCQEASNPFDITRNDAVNGIKDSNNYETDAGDMFRDISGNPNIKKVSEIHDNGFYTSLCWIEITTITEINNGSKSAIREYAITFETPSDIPEKYIRKKSEHVDGETIQYKIFDRDTRKSEVVNFTTISRSKESIVRQNRKILCGSGPVYTKEFMEWPHSNRKRVEIRVSPKRQNLVASDCIVLNANVENISTLSSTRRDFDSGSHELLTGEGTEGSNTLKYPTPESLVKITSQDIETESTGFRSNNIKKNMHVENTETTIQRISPSQSTPKPLLPENTTEPKVENKTLKSDTFKPNKAFLPLTKLPKQLHMKKSDFNLTHTPLLKPPSNENMRPEFITRTSTSKETESEDYEHLGATKNLASENTPHTSVTRFQPKVTIKKARTEIINEEGADSTEMIGSQTTNADSHTEHYLVLHSTKLPPNMEDTLFVNEDVSPVLDHGGVTEVLKNIEFTTELPKISLNTLPAIVTYRISSTTASNKHHHVEAEDSKLKNTQVLTEPSNKPSFNPNVTPDKYQDLPNTESDVVDKYSTMVPLTTNSNYDVSYAPTGMNVILNKTSKSFTTSNKSVPLESITKHPKSINYSDVNSAVTHGFLVSELTSRREFDNPITTQNSILINEATKTTTSSLSSEDVTFNTLNTLVTKRLRSGSHLKFVTRPAMKPYTKILKNVDKNILKGNNGQGESSKMHLKSSTTERITTSRSHTNEDLDEATYTKIEPATNYTPVDNYFTDDVLLSSLETTTEYDTVEREQTNEMVSQLPAIESASASKGLLDPAQQVTNDFENLKPALPQVKPSQRPVQDNSVNDKIGSVSLPDNSKYTTANGLPTRPVLQKFSDLPQKHITVLESLPDEEENKETDLEISKPENILTELPFTLSRELSNINHITDISKNGRFESTTTSISRHPLRKTTETLLDGTQIKNRVSETVVNLLQQPKGSTEQPSRLRDITNSLSDLSHKDTTVSTTVSDNLLDEIGDTKTDSSIPNSMPTNTDYQSFDGPLHGKSPSDFESDSLIHPFKSTAKPIIVLKSTTDTISLSNIEDGTYGPEKNFKIPVHVKTVMPHKLTTSDINSPLYYSKSTTEQLKPEENTYSAKTDLIGQGSTPQNKPDKPSPSLLNEMQSTKIDLEAPTRSKIKITTPDETVLPTDTYSITSVTVLDNLSNQLESTTKIRKSVLNDRQSTKESAEKPTRKQTIISSEPISSYNIVPETTTEFSKSLSNHFSLKPEKNINSSEIPITAEYISLKPTQKPYSNVPNIYSNDVHFAGRFTSTEGTTTTAKYPSELISIRDTDSTTEKLVLGNHQNTAKGIDVEQTVYSKLPLKHSNQTTSTESFTFEWDKYKNPPTYVPLSKMPYTGLTLKYPTGMSSITHFTSSERSVDIHHSTIKDTKLKQKVSTKLPIKYSSDTSSKEDVASSDILADLVQATTQDTNPQWKTYSRLSSQYSNNTSSRGLVSVTSPKSLLPNSFKSTSHHPRYHLESEKFQSMTDNGNLGQKPNSQIPFNHPSDAYFTADFTSPSRLPEKFRSTTENAKTGHEFGKYSTGGLTSSATLLDEPENSFREQYFVNGFTTASSSLNYPQTTITKVFSSSSVVHPYVQHKKNRTVPLENLNKFDRTDKNVTNYTRATNFELSESNSIAANTESSTNRLTHILKSLNKSLCNNTKQTILVRVKILMEHILEENDNGTITKHAIPIMGIEKKTEFDFKPKKLLPIVTQKKLNDDWSIFLDDLAKNFFDFNRHVVQNYTELKPKNLNLNIPGYEFGGDIVSPRESIQRIQRIRNSMNRCKNKHGNKVSREPKFTVDKKSLLFRNKHAKDNDNKENNFKLTTQSVENLTSNFYRFFLGAPSRNAQLEVDNKPVKVEIPTTLVLPFNEHSKMNVIKALNDWQGKPNIVLRNVEYMTPIPGSYRGGYKQFSLSDLFPVSAKSEIGQYVPEIIYHTAPKIVPEIFRSYSAVKDYEMHNVLASHNPQTTIDIGPRIEEYRKSTNRNSPYATSITSSSTNGGVDFKTATVKAFRHKHKVNDNLKKIRIKQFNVTNTVHINEEDFLALGKLSKNATKETSNFSSQISHNSIVNNNLDNSGHQTSGRVNLNPITENYKSEHSTPYKIIDFKSILDGIINKLNAVLEKLSNR